MGYDEGFYRNLRHAMPNAFQKWIDRYAYEGEELQDLQQRTVIPFQRFTYDLSTAQSPALELNIPGRGFAVYGFTTGDATRTIVSDILVNIGVNQNHVENQLPMKHQRGFRGDFFRLYLSWAAQSGNSFDIVIFKFDDRPWMGGQEAT